MAITTNPTRLLTGTRVFAPPFYIRGKFMTMPIKRLIADFTILAPIFCQRLKNDDYGTNADNASKTGLQVKKFLQN